MKKKKVFTILISIVASLAVVFAIVVPCLYENGFLVTEHNLQKPNADDIRIACVGDSITYGCRVSHWTKNNYPTVLDGLLGDGYCVNNYAYSARTCMRDGDYPLTNELIYKKSLKFNPNIVIIMFGTNDTKPQNWKGIDAFLEDYMYIINSYRALESSPKIYVIAPPPVWCKQGKTDNLGISPTIIANELRIGIKEFAHTNGLGFIDMYPVFEDRKDLFPDGIHPNADGARLFAETVYNQLKNDLI